MCRLMTVLAFLLLTPSAPAQDKTRPQQSPAELESRLLKAMAAPKPDSFRDLAKNICRLTKGQRRALNFRLRPGVVEFRFSGECPGHTDRNVEFIVSNKNRDYESLLVLDKGELERAKRVWKVFKQLSKAGQTAVVEFKILWVENKKARYEDLYDVFRKKRKTDYRRYLEWEEDGLRIPNIAMDLATVPLMRQPAQMILILRLGAKARGGKG